MLNSKFDCNHYQRKCLIITLCCKKIYPCRLCHDKEEDHQLISKNVEEIKCVICGFIQLVQNNCQKCGTKFGKYYCKKCRLFDDTDKKQFHCEGCDICRIGGRENYYHDYVCGMCYQKGTVHKCIENIGRSPCPVCLEDLHTSTIPCIVNKCGHILHQTCLRILKTNSDNNCPLCRTPMITDEDLEKLTSAQLVLETRVEILCYNCGHTFHTLANENGYTCLDCHSTHTGLIT